MSSNVALVYPTKAGAAVVDLHHRIRNLIPEKTGKLSDRSIFQNLIPEETGKLCVRSIFFPANYRFKFLVVSPEKPGLFLLVVSTVIPYKSTLACFTKPFTVGKNDVGMPVLLEVRKGTKEFIQEAFENGKLQAALGWPAVYVNDTKAQMGALSDLTKVLSNQNVLQRTVDNTKRESISIPTISTVILPASQLKDADQTPRPYENPDDDGSDCRCCAIM